MTDVYADTEYNVTMLAVLAEHRGFAIRKMPLKFGTGGLKMALDEAIKHCLDIADGQDKCAEISVSEHAKERISQCAADHRQLAEWLTELKEAKRLLKAAVEDMNKEADCGICLHDNDGECPIEVASCKFKWRYADEALALIGKDTNVPASKDGDTNG